MDPIVVIGDPKAANCGGAPPRQQSQDSHHPQQNSPILDGTPTVTSLSVGCGFDRGGLIASGESGKEKPAIKAPVPLTDAEIEAYNRITCCVCGESVLPEEVAEHSRFCVLEPAPKLSLQLDKWCIAVANMTPAEQRTFVQMRRTEELARVHEVEEELSGRMPQLWWMGGRFGYIISSRWLRDWRSFVGVGKPSSSTQDRPPSPINNQDLFELDGSLRANLREGLDFDYQVLDQPVWDMFLQVYGGGPAVLRYNSNGLLPRPEDHEAIFDGDWQDLRPHSGHGRVFDPVTSYGFDGELRGGCLWDCEGKGLLQSGSHYEGHVVKGFPDGEGREVCPDGIVIEGTFREGLLHGHGRVTNLDGSVEEGECGSSRSTDLGEGPLTFGHLVRETRPLISLSLDGAKEFRGGASWPTMPNMRIGTGDSSAIATRHASDISDMSAPSFHQSEVSLPPPEVGDSILVGRNGLRAVLRFRGSTHFAAGDWCGIEFEDVQKGKHDGEVEGVRYFESHKAGNYCLFVRPSFIIQAASIATPRLGIGKAAGPFSDAVSPSSSVSSVRRPSAAATAAAGDTPCCPAVRSPLNAGGWVCSGEWQERARRSLAEAVEDKDLASIRAQVPRLEQRLGAAHPELEVAVRTLALETQRRLAIDMEALREQVSKFASHVEFTERKAQIVESRMAEMEAAKQEAMKASTPVALTQPVLDDVWEEQLFRRFEARLWEQLEQRASRAIEGPVAAATGHLSQVAAELKDLLSDVADDKFAELVAAHGVVQGCKKEAAKGAQEITSLRSTAAEAFRATEISRDSAAGAVAEVRAAQDAVLASKEEASQLVTHMEFMERRARLVDSQNAPIDAAKGKEIQAAADVDPATVILPSASIGGAPEQRLREAIADVLAATLELKEEAGRPREDLVGLSKAATEVAGASTLPAESVAIAGQGSLDQSQLSEAAIVKVLKLTQQMRQEASESQEDSVIKFSEVVAVACEAVAQVRAEAFAATEELLEASRTLKEVRLSIDLGNRKDNAAGRADVNAIVNEEKASSINLRSINLRGLGRNESGSGIHQVLDEAEVAETGTPSSRSTQALTPAAEDTPVPQEVKRRLRDVLSFATRSGALQEICSKPLETEAPMGRRDSIASAASNGSIALLKTDVAAKLESAEERGEIQDFVAEMMQHPIAGGQAEQEAPAPAVGNA